MLGEEDVKPNIAHLSSPAPALPTPPAKRPTQGVASFPRSEVPANCYGPDKALARKAFSDEAIRRLKNECKVVSDFRWRDDGACADWVVCLSDGTWNVWYPEGAVGTWGKKEKDAFREAAKKDVGRTGWIVTKVREFTDGRGIEVLWTRRQKERIRDKDSTTVESAETAMEGVVIGPARPTASGSGSDAVGEIAVAVDGLGLGTILPVSPIKICLDATLSYLSSADRVDAFAVRPLDRTSHRTFGSRGSWTIASCDTS